jgi:peptide/nickel transport system substrate-binding protein
VKHAKAIAVIAVASLGVLAACTGGGDETTSASAPDHATTDVVVQAIDDNREGPAEPIDGAVEGGTVTVLSQAMSTGTLDPTQAWNPDVLTILRGLVTRSLTQSVYNPAQHTMVLVPDIATDTGRPNADFTSWRFTIRDGVRYENGDEVTAADVAFGIKRSFDRTTFDEGPNSSNAYFLDGDTYQGPYRSGSNYPGVVVDGKTVTIKMDHPFPDMPLWASYPAIGPIPELGSNPITYWRHPLATGPYRIARYTPEKSLTLVRNRQWDPDTDPGRHAYPDRYVFDFTVSSKQAIVTTILGDSSRGSTSVAYQGPTAPDFITTSVYHRARKLNQLTVGPGPCTNWLALNNRKITDIRVRKAIGYAYPYQDAAASGYFDVSTWVPGTSILPPGFPGRLNFNPLSTRPGSTHADKAKALLKSAGYAPGEYVLKWPYNTGDPTSVAQNEALIHAFQVAGFTTKPYRLGNGHDLMAMSADPKAPINLHSDGWCPDWPSGISWFTDTFRSRGWGNAAYFAEPTVDAEIDRISQLPIDEQPPQWGALDKAIMTDYYPVVITGYRQAAMLHGSHIAGMNVDNNWSMPTWQDLHVIP